MSMSMNEYDQWLLRQKQEAYAMEQHQVKGAIAGGNIGEQRQEQPVAAAMNQLDKNLAMLQDHIIQLESRLTPILQEIPPAPKELNRITRDLGGTSALVSQIRSLNNHVIGLQDRIVDIRERVEV
jgi:hypothetical protein